MIDEAMEKAALEEQTIRASKKITGDVLTAQKEELEKTRSEFLEEFKNLYQEDLDGVREFAGEKGFEAQLRANGFSAQYSSFGKTFNSYRKLRELDGRVRARVNEELMKYCGLPGTSEIG